MADTRKARVPMAEQIRLINECQNGYLETDGYQGHNNLPGIRRCCCWTHIRRYFIDAVPKGKQYDYSQPAVQGVQYTNRLFAISELCS